MCMSKLAVLVPTSNDVLAFSGVELLSHVCRLTEKFPFARGELFILSIENLFSTTPTFQCLNIGRPIKSIFISGIAHNNNKHINIMFIPNPNNNTNVPTTQPPFITPPPCNPQRQVPQVMQMQEPSDQLHTTHETNKS